MNVTLCSAFRNSAEYVVRYQLQVAQLAYALARRSHGLHTIWCEGDSVDDSLAKLLDGYERDGKRCGYTADIFHFHHGGPDHGSIVNPVRFANMAKVWNRIWARIPEDARAVIFVEADLVWQPETMLTLLDRLSDYPAIAPMILLERRGYTPGFFYDNWGFWRNGVQIEKMPPYFADWTPDAPMQIDSAGSCIVMRGDLARQVTWPSEDVVRGVCRLIYEQGGSVWLDPTATVIHL